MTGPVARLLGLHRPEAASGDRSLPPAGAQVEATVQKYLGKGVWLLDLDGTQVEARSRLSLFPGLRLRAELLRQGGSIFLVSRPGGGHSLETVLTAAHLPDNAASRTVISLLLSAGAPARPELLERLSTLLRRRPGTGGRLEAEAIARGLPELLEELSALVTPAEGSGGNSRGQSEERRQGQEREEEGADGARRLKSALLRTTEVGNHPLQLYNHRALLASGWITLPLRFTAAELGQIAPGR
ncbi:MAG: hypothetical protein ACLFP6_07470, partial [Spirochaetaceae bacterium]